MRRRAQRRDVRRRARSPGPRRTPPRHGPRPAPRRAPPSRPAPQPRSRARGARPVGARARKRRPRSSSRPRPSVNRRVGSSPDRRGDRGHENAILLDPGAHVHAGVDRGRSAGHCELEAGLRPRPRAPPGQAMTTRPGHQAREGRHADASRRFRLTRGQRAVGALPSACWPLAAMPSTGPARQVEDLRVVRNRVLVALLWRSGAADQRGPRAARPPTSTSAETLSWVPPLM